MPVHPRSHLRRLTPYEWEASASEIAAAAGIPESAVVRFDTNTTPWPPVAWEQTVRALPRLPANEYPHPSNEPLRSAVAARLGVRPTQVVVTSGADEALALLASVFLGPRRSAVAADPSFAMFRVVTEAVGAQLVRVPLDERWDLPCEAFLAAASRPGVSVVWLCSPNNPTGRLLDPGLVAAVAGRLPDMLVVVDEAYHEIAGETVAPLLACHPNLVLVRTFSKGYGLAGARVGYLAADHRITRELDAVRLPQNVSAFGLAAAAHALADQAGLAQRVAALRAERERLRAALEARGWQVVPSQANFLLAHPPVQPSVYSTWLQAAGLVVRSYPGQHRLAAYLRVGVRSPAEDDRLLARLDAYPAAAVGPRVARAAPDAARASNYPGPETRSA